MRKCIASVMQPSLVRTLIEGQALAGIRNGRNASCCKRREPALAYRPETAGRDRLPKIALPTRTWVAPSWIAASKSALMPMDSAFNP